MMFMRNYYKPAPGEIILIRFPFTDLSSNKVRPALIISAKDDQDILVAPISTTVNMGRDDLPINKKDFIGKPLPIASCLRYKKLFTLNRKLILKNVSAVSVATFKKIQQKIVRFILD